MNKATLFDIERSSFVDGPGIRTTVFFKGCHLNCAWCHNPEGKSTKREKLFYAEKCTDCGLCRRVCPSPEACTLCGVCEHYCPSDAIKICGKEYTTDEILSEVLKDREFYRSSGGGVTCSGGECMLQIDALSELLQKCKAAGLHTAVDTAGHLPWQFFQRILPHTDLFLYDIKAFDAQIHQKYVGVKNDLILENLQKLLQNKVRVWVRIPIICGVNDRLEELRKIRDFLDAAGKPEKIELLPYHRMGENKYRALGMSPQHFAVPSPETMRRLEAVFAEA